MVKKFKGHQLSRRKKVEAEPSELLKTLVGRNKLLIKLFVELAKVHTKKHLFDFVASYCLKIFNVDACAIHVPDQEGKYLVPASIRLNSKILSSALEKVQLVQRSAITLEYPHTKAFLTRKIVITKEKDIPAVIRRFGVKKGFCIPLVAKNHSVGVLTIGGKVHYEVADEDLEIVQLLALFIAERYDKLELLDSLRRHSTEMEVVQNSIREGLSLHGPDGVIYYANKTVGKLFGTIRKTVGLTREEVIKNWSRYHRYKIDRFFDVEEMNKAVYEEQKAFSGVMKVLSSPERFVEANYIPILREGKLVGTAATYRDITYEKHQEQQISLQLNDLQTERDRWRAIFQNVDEGICLLDKDFRILHINSACEATISKTTSEVEGQYYWDVFDCHTKTNLRYPDFNPLSKILVTEEPIPYDEHLHTTATGTDYWVGVSATPIKNTQGEIEEIVLVVRDISAMKEVEKAKSEFVSIASHELRTPLTVVNGYLSLLLSGDLGDFADPESRSTLFTILRKVAGETSRLTDLVSDLLNVSRIEEKRVQLEPRLIKLAEIIEPVVEEMLPMAIRKSISLELQPPGQLDGLSLVADKNKLTQVLVNLIDNAIKYTPNGGKVCVKCWDEKEEVFVQIEDNGIGIPKRLFPIIFEKFQQAPGSYLKENRGTGLGLFIVKSLVELHHGGLEVESETGKGSRFTFHLPKG